MTQQFRTDLAVERTAAAPDLPGIIQETRGKAFSVTEIRIKNDVCGAPIGKPAGRYVTLEAAAISRSSADYEAMAEELAEELGHFLPEEGCVFLAGLGNHAITPDALGPRVASKVLATRHLRTALSEEELSYLPELRPVCVLAGGVLGQTGMESAELIEAVCKQIQPAAVVAVDALACAELSRLGKTIQMSDSGISPGSGVANRRAELSRRTLGVPVIALGIPAHCRPGHLREKRPERSPQYDGHAKGHRPAHRPRRRSAGVFSQHGAASRHDLCTGGGSGIGGILLYKYNDQNKIFA